MAKLVDEPIGVIGRDIVVALSADYAHGNRLDQLIEDTVGRISDPLEDGTGLSAALTAFSADRAVRIMSIHKSKGLEFDTVIMMTLGGGSRRRTLGTRSPTGDFRLANGTVTGPTRRGSETVSMQSGTEGSKRRVSCKPEDDSNIELG